MKSKVSFLSHGIKIAGIMYIPDDYYGRMLTGIVVCHPAGGVKEQTAGRYAEELSKRGFAALTFDAARQGESEGEPRGLEDPFQRAEDIRSAVSYLSSVCYVDENNIGILGVCAAGSRKTDRILSPEFNSSRKIKRMENKKVAAGRNYLGSFASLFAELNDDVLFGQVWSRVEKLAHLIMVAALMGDGIVDVSMKGHLEKTYN